MKVQFIYTEKHKFSKKSIKNYSQIYKNEDFHKKIETN